MERWYIGKDAERREIDPATVAVIATRTPYRRVPVGTVPGGLARAPEGDVIPVTYQLSHCLLSARRDALHAVLAAFPVDPARAGWFVPFVPSSPGRGSSAGEYGSPPTPAARVAWGDPSIGPPLNIDTSPGNAPGMLAPHALVQPFTSPELIPNHPRTVQFTATHVRHLGPVIDAEALLLPPRGLLRFTAVPVPHLTCVATDPRLPAWTGGEERWLPLPLFRIVTP